MKVCKDQIDILKNRIHDEETEGSGRTWLQFRDDASHADMVAHKHGVVRIFFLAPFSRFAFPPLYLAIAVDI